MAYYKPYSPSRKHIPAIIISRQYVFRKNNNGLLIEILYILPCPSRRLEQGVEPGNVSLEVVTLVKTGQFIPNDVSDPLREKIDVYVLAEWDLVVLFKNIHIIRR
jgi:hypothetical protein